MKRIAAIFVVLIIQSAFAQIRPYISEIKNLINSSANAFFLSANRPSYGVSTEMSPKGDFSIGTGFYFNRDIYEIPIDLSYGSGKRSEIIAGISAFTQTINFNGEKVRGIGDSYLGIKYRFHESDYFDHVIQAIVKIPTASKSRQLGTGKADFYFGIAEGFYYDNFSYDLGFECNLLTRRDFPALNKDIPVILREELANLKQKYDYRFEPEICLTLSPSYSFTDNLFAYTGYSFTRNTRLNFNTHSLLFGIGIAAGRSFSFSLGSTIGLGQNSGWYAGAGINYTISRKK